MHPTEWRGWPRFCRTLFNDGLRARRHVGTRLDLELLDDRMLPSVITWGNPAGGDWDTGSNWNGGQPPGSADDAVINLTGITVTHAAGADAVHSLISQASLTLSGGTLSLAAASTINGTLTLTGGTLSGAGTVTVNGPTAWSAGTMTGGGVTVANGGMALSGSDEYLDGRTLDNNGIAAWTGFSDWIHLLNGAVWNNGAGGVLDSQNDDQQLRDDGGAASAFNNAGTFEKSGGTANSFVRVAFSNSGSVQALSGTLQLSGAFSNFANNTLTGGTYFVRGLFLFVSAAIHTDAANIVLDGPAAEIENEAHHDALDGLTTIAAAGSLTLQNGASLTTNGPLVNNGAVTVGPNGPSPLVAFYPFDDGTANDASGHGNNGTFSPNPPTFTASGYQGGALQFTAANNNFVTLPVNIGPAAMPQVTMGGWFNASSLVTSTGVIRGVLSSDDGGFDRTIDVDTRAGKGLRWAAFDGSGAFGQDQVVADQWVFAVARYDQGSGLTLFNVDGAQYLKIRTVDATATSTTTLGRNPTFDFPFDGLIDNVFICNTFLSDSWIEAIRTGGAAAITATQISTLKAPGGYTQGAGTTTLAGGTLTSGGGPVTVNGGTLTGAGTVNGGLLNAGGQVAPGGPAGALGVTGAYTQQPAGALDITIAGPTAGSQYDQLTSSGAINLTGSVLNLTVPSSYNPAAGTQFDVLVNSSGSAIIGTFAGLPEGAILFGGTRLFTLTYQGGASGHDVVLTSTTLTPIAVSSVAINGNSAALAGSQRSMVSSLVYTFNHPVTLAPGAFTIGLRHNVTVSGVLQANGYGTLPALAWATTDNGRTWVVTFSGVSVVNGSIADGIYDLTLHASAVTDAASQVLAADRVDTFYRLFGDADGNRKVNNLDLAIFSSTFNKRSTQSGYLAYLDYDGNGVINNSDLAQLASRFNTSFGGF